MPAADDLVIVPGQTGLGVHHRREQVPGEQADRLARTLGWLGRAGHLVVRRRCGDEYVLRHPFLQHGGEIGAAHQRRRRKRVGRQQLAQELFQYRLHARELASEGVDGCALLRVPDLRHHIGQPLTDAGHQLGKALGKLRQPVVRVQLALEPEREAQYRVFFFLGEGAGKRPKP